MKKHLAGAPNGSLSCKTFHPTLMNEARRTWNNTSCMTSVLRTGAVRSWLLLLFSGEYC